MKVLFVCSGNKGIVPFITEQGESLKKEGIDLDYYTIEGKGAAGYLKNLKPLAKKINNGDYNLIHAHYGLSGLLGVLQRRVPTIITYHGSDVNNLKHRFFSLVASRLSAHNIVVNKYMVQQLFLKKNYTIIPCGVDLNTFYPVDKAIARKILGLDMESRYILFSSSFDNLVKNYPLADEAVNKLDEPVKMIELINKSRKEVNLLLNACDLLLMTSFTEGSPQIVKEALVCNTPVVSTKVGDVPNLLEDLKNCHLSSFDSDDVCHKIILVFSSNDKSETRSLLDDYELQTVAKSIKQLYIEKLKYRSN